MSLERISTGHQSQSSSRNQITRRALLATLGSGLLPLVSGCVGGLSGTTPTPSQATEPPSTGTEPPTNTPPTSTPAEGSPTNTPPEESPTSTPAEESVTARRVLYLYGDVAADGSVPSGDAEPFHQMRLDDTGDRGLSEFRAALESAGFVPEQQYDAEVRLSTSALDRYDVLILGSNQRRFDDEERQAVRAWVEDGGGLVAWSDSAFGGNYSEVGVCNPAGSQSNNDLTEQFGMEFLRDNGSGNYRIETYERDHFVNGDDKNGGVVFRGEGVSCVRVSRPATMLARLQAGGLNGKLRVCDADAPYQPDRDAALAVATVGAGRVVGTFDRNTFWNAGEGTNISEVDNREYGLRLIRWAAGEGE